MKTSTAKVSVSVRLAGWMSFNKLKEIFVLISQNTGSCRLWKNCHHSFIVLFTATVCLLLYKNSTYTGIAHDARIYAADLLRDSSMVPMDLLSLNPQQKGTIFTPAFALFCKIFPVQLLFHIAYLLFCAGNFLLTYILFKTVLKSNNLFTTILAITFNIVQWEILTSIITQNESFFTVRPVAFFFIQSGLIFSFKYHKTLQPRYLFISSLCAGLSFSLHPISGIYFFLIFLSFPLKTYPRMLFGGLCGLFPFILLQILPWGVTGNIDYQAGRWTPDLIQRVLRNNFYLFPSAWPEQSQDKLFSTTLFLFFLAYIYRKTLLGRITFISTAVCGTLIAVSIIADYCWIHNLFLISIQPMRAVTVLNLYLFMLFAQWITDDHPRHPPVLYRIGVFSLFTALHFCISSDISLQCAVVAGAWYVFPTFRKKKKIFYFLFSAILFQGGLTFFPKLFEFKLSYHPALFLIFIPSAILFFHLRRQARLLFYLAAGTAVILQANQQFITRIVWKSSGRNSKIVYNLRHLIPPGSTVVYLPTSTKDNFELSVFRYGGHYKLYFDGIDNAPACFSAKYSREYLRRCDFIDIYSRTGKHYAQLNDKLKSEHIQFVFSLMERQLRLVGRFNDIKVYAVD